MTNGIGDRLKRIRGESGLSQREFSSRVGISFSTWQTIENGKNVPSGETLLKIAGLGFDPGWILTGRGFMRLEEPSDAGGLEAGGELIGPPPDSELMGRVVDTIMRVAKSCGVSIPPVDLGRQAMERYAELMAASSDPDERLAMLKLMAVQLKAELTAPLAPGSADAPASRKGSA